MRRARVAGLAALAAALAAGCGGTPPPLPATGGGGPDLHAEYGKLAAQAGSQDHVLALDPAASSVRILVFRGGAAARAGHNHVLSAPEFGGYVYLPAGKPQQARFDLDFPLQRLAIDDPALRSDAGAAFATPLDQAARNGTRAHMLGPDNLDAARYPEVLVHGEQLTGEWPHLVAAVSLSLHGASRSLLVPLDAQWQGERLTVAGAFAIRQSDFGARPYSALGGLLKVEDAVAIDFRLVARPTAFGPAS